MRFTNYTTDKIREFSLEFIKVLEENSHQFKESKFSIFNLSPQEQDVLYQNFYNTYMNSVGSAWTKSEFEHKADLWTFWGTVDGGIAARKQNSGMWKLNACYGSPMSVFKGFKEMVNDIGDQPIWGAMTDNVAIQLEKASTKMGSDNLFLRVPGLIAKAIAPHIKKVFGDSQNVQINSYGSLTVQDPSGKPMTKYLIANKKYYQNIIDQMENNPDKLPIPILVQKGIIGALKLFYGKYFK